MNTLILIFITSLLGVIATITSTSILVKAIRKIIQEELWRQKLMDYSKQENKDGEDSKGWRILS